eukprot:EC719009.1.p2 GENE.EC719009.1~~EC719009.1.p2  ORF type:complete len:91 (+),score=20.98 EC719009.1:148-420(+)
MRYHPELLTFTVYVFPTVSPSLTFVEVRRGKGDRLDLNRFYRLLLRTVKKGSASGHRDTVVADEAPLANASSSSSSSSPAAAAAAASSSL